MLNRGFLITGTDTGVGKTLVACSLATALRQQGLRVVPFKPVETGCEADPVSGELIPADAVLLRKASGTDADLGMICPYRFSSPVAPWVAARQSNVHIDPERLLACYQNLASSHDVVLVETAGGIMVPLAENFHYGDLAQKLRLPALVVIGSKLGAINHALLTFAFLQQAGIKIVAWVLNHPYQEVNPATQTNGDTLRALLPGPFFSIPHLPDSQNMQEHESFQKLSASVLDHSSII